jgi:hypothetical protein
MRGAWIDPVSSHVMLTLFADFQIFEGLAPPLLASWADFRINPGHIFRRRRQ